MTDLVILGAGVHAAEMVEIVDRVNAAGRRFNLLGLIARKPEDVGRDFNGAPVLGTFEAMPRLPETVAFAASNANKLPDPLPVPLERLVSLVDPTAFVSRTARVGRGCVVYPGCFVGLQATLEDLVFMLGGCVVNHDVVLGERTVLTSGVTLAGGVRVGKGAYLGQASSVREKVSIGDGATVGMGAVVIRDVPARIVVAGNPARELKKQA